MTDASPDRIQDRLKDNNFDLLRLIFASMVVYFHIALLSQTPSLHWMEQYISSTFAVQAFFFVSGFLVTMSMERSSSLKSYFSKRFWRIAPAYFVVVTGAAILLFSASQLSPQEYFTNPGWRKYLIHNLLLSNFTAPSLPGVFSSNHESAVNGSLWTIKIEAAFYLCVPVIVWLTRRYGYQKPLLVIFILSLLWKCGFIAASDSSGVDLYGKLAKQIPGQLSFFVGGAYAYHRTKNGLPPPPILLLPVAIGAYILSEGIIYHAIAPIAVTIIVYILSISTPRMINAGKYGDFSYGIYLYHFPMVQALVSAGLFNTHPIASTVAITLLTATISILSWFFVERRFLARSSAPK